MHWYPSPMRTWHCELIEPAFWAEHNTQQLTKQKSNKMWITHEMQCVSHPTPVFSLPFHGKEVQSTYETWKQDKWFN